MIQVRAKAREYYQHIVFLVLTVALILLVYWSDLLILANEALANEVFNYALLIPLFFGILFYLRKDALKAEFALQSQQQRSQTKHVERLIGVVICLIAFLIYWYGSYTIYPLEYHLLTLPIFAIGMTLILTSLRVLRILIVPLLFLFFVVPLPVEILTRLGDTMANFNTQAAYTILRTFGVPVTLTSNYGAQVILLTTAAGRPAMFTVDIACSGVYSLIAFAMVGAFLALIVTASLPKKIILFAAGFVVFDILNIIRLTGIFSIGYWLGEESAMLLFHSVAGLLLIFGGMIFTLFAAEKTLKIQVLPKLPSPPSCPTCETNRKRLADFCSNCGTFLNPVPKRVSRRLWAMLFILFLGCSLVTLSVNAPTFTTMLGPQSTAVGYEWQNATNVFPQISTHNLQFLKRDAAYEKIANQYLNLIYGYNPLDLSDRVVFVYLAVADNPSNLHNWEDCLISWQVAQGQSPLVNQLDRKEISILPDVPLPGQYLVFENGDGNYTQVTLYWYERAAFKTGITVSQKYVRISLLTITKNSTEYPQLEDKLLTMGKTIASYWEPLKNQSLASLGVPTIQVLIALSATAIVLMGTTQYYAEQRRKNTNTRLFSRYASPKEKIALRAIENLAKEHKIVETKDIRIAISRKIGKPVKLVTLLKVLNQLEHNGFIRKDIAHINNSLYLSWKL